MISRITGKDNKTLKMCRALKRKNGRAEQGRFIAEGRKLVLEAFSYATDKIYCVVLTEDFAEKEPQILKDAEKVCDKVFIVENKAFEDISDTDTPQGILAVVNIPKDDFEPDSDTKSIVILDGVSEPGNMGTVIRTAEALGYDGVCMMKGCADVYSPKTVRSTMGSVFRMKFKTGCDLEYIKSLQEKGFFVIATTPVGELALEALTVPEKTAVVIGNEAHGVCDELMGLAQSRVRISMDGMAESLNAAVAAGIVMHWIKNSGRG